MRTGLAAFVGVAIFVVTGAAVLSNFSSIVACPGGALALMAAVSAHLYAHLAR